MYAKSWPLLLSAMLMVAPLFGQSERSLVA